MARKHRDRVTSHHDGRISERLTDSGSSNVPAWLCCCGRDLNGSLRSDGAAAGSGVHSESNFLGSAGSFSFLFAHEHRIWVSKRLPMCCDCYCEITSRTLFVNSKSWDESLKSNHEFWNVVIEKADCSFNHVCAGISRSSFKKRRATGGKKPIIRKKRKFELGRFTVHTYTALVLSRETN